VSLAFEEGDGVPADMSGSYAVLNPINGIRISSDTRCLLSMAGKGSVGRWEHQEPERVLATVLFTDIVGSTRKGAANETH
jgi:hypothetical protein